MQNWDRQYRFSAGQAGSTGFEIGQGSRPLHISFSVERADTDSANTAKVSLWNLSPEHLAELNKDDCVVVLKAGVRQRDAPRVHRRGDLRKHEARRQ